MVADTRSILVTGASTGIGRAAVLALLSEGFLVYAGVRDAAAGQALRAAAPAEAAGRLEIVLLDVTDLEQVRAVARHLDHQLGETGLWGLFNNAGISVTGPIEFVGIEAVRHQFEVNVIGPVAVTQALIPLLRRARGRVVTTGSVTGFIALPGLSPYAMSKHAMEAFSDSLRRETRAFGIEVSLLEPGAIATDIWQKGMEAADAAEREWPPQVTALYGPMIRAMRRAAELSARRASPTDVVTRAVVHAFTAARPRTRYRLGSHSGIQKWISRLPDRCADALLMKALGLPSQPGAR